MIVSLYREAEQKGEDISVSSFCLSTSHLVDVELALTSGKLSVAGGEFANEVVAGRQSRQSVTYRTTKAELHCGFKK